MKHPVAKSAAVVTALAYGALVYYAPDIAALIFFFACGMVFLCGDILVECLEWYDRRNTNK